MHSLQMSSVPSGVTMHPRSPNTMAKDAVGSNLRRHRGDIMSPEKRSALMSRIRGRDTGPELLVAASLKRMRWRFECHAADLPGKPDFVFRRARVAVFVDGDFWHGWRFDAWRDKLSPAWEAKIEANRRRDSRNFRRLRRMGWTVIRVWEHQVKRDLERQISRIHEKVGLPRKSRPGAQDLNI